MKSRLWPVMALFALLAVPAQSSAQPPLPPFDINTGNSLIERIIPAVIPVVLEDISIGANDATLVLRITTEITTASFDAIAPYHPTAVGIYSRLGRRPAAEGQDNRNKNIAIFHATHKVLTSLLPNRAAEWDGLLASVGLNPADNSVDLTTAVGIGNVAGVELVTAREHDGMNQLGDEGGRVYNRQPYADYTGFAPVNTAYDLVNPSRWQPLITTLGNGIFKVQQYVTPQLAITEPFALENPRRYRSRRPWRSERRGRIGRAAYRRQAEQVLEISANLNDESKAKAEFFDNKFRSIGFVALFVAQRDQMTLDEFVQYDMMENIAAFDAAIVMWREKTRWNAVRPESAIAYLYGDDPVTAWGGPGQGTVNDLPGTQFKSYVPTPDHPEYPSGSACFCASAAQASRRFTGTDQLGWEVLVPQGFSMVEPGITPSQDTLLSFPTWTNFEQECARARVYAGAHFVAATEEALRVCRPIGDEVYEFVQSHIDGTAD